MSTTDLLMLRHLLDHLGEILDGGLVRALDSLLLETQTRDILRLAEMSRCTVRSIENTAPDENPVRKCFLAVVIIHNNR